MEMIPKAVVLHIIDTLIKIDKQAMEDIITKDKVAPKESDLMRLTHNKTIQFIKSVKREIAKLKSNTPLKEGSNELLSLAEQQNNIMKHLSEVVIAIKELAKIVRTNTTDSLRTVVLLKELAETVNKLEKGDN